MSRFQSLSEILRTMGKRSLQKVVPIPTLDLRSSVFVPAVSVTVPGVTVPPNAESVKAILEWFLPPNQDPDPVEQALRLYTPEEFHHPFDNSFEIIIGRIIRDDFE